MTCREFVDAIRGMKPGIEVLKEEQYNDKEIEEIEVTYELRETGVEGNLYPILGELGEVMTRYDLSSMEIGWIFLFNEPVEKDGLFYVGKAQDDDIIYSPLGKFFYVCENGKLLWYIANSPCNLLAAVAKIAEFFTRMRIETGLYEDEALLIQYANEATRLAGKAEYGGFYRALINVE